MDIRIRFKDPQNPIKYIRGRDLAPHPANWRTHPKEQLDALRGIMAEVGMCDAVKGFELPDGRIMLIDGHARAEILPDQEVPVLLLDVTEEEAKKLLATFDPVGDIAGTNKELLDGLLKSLEIESPALQAMLDGLANQHGLAEDVEPEEPEDASNELVPEKYQIIVDFDTEADQTEWLQKLMDAGLKCKSLIS